MLQKEIFAVFLWDKYKTHKYNVGCAFRLWKLNWWYKYWPLVFRIINLFYKTRQLMMYREIIAVGSQIHAKQNILCVDIT